MCKNGCAQKIDVFKQQEIFIKLNDLKKWSQRTLFLRSLVATKPLKVNLNPIIDIKKKEKMYNYHLFNDEGLLTQVCQSFFTKVLQIGREKVYRAISSAQANPNAYERRGKSMKKKNADLNKQNLKAFIGSFITYDNHRSSVKYLHPKLNIRIMFQLYQEDCVFKQRNMLSESVFRQIMKKDFKLDFVRRTKPSCNVCELNKNDQENVVPNQPTQTTENQPTKKDDHLTIVTDIKN